MKTVLPVDAFLIVGTYTLTNKKVFHVKELDKVVTMEEVRKVIADATDSEPEIIDIRSLRPAYGDQQNATVCLPELVAEKLLQYKALKIG